MLQQLKRHPFALLLMAAQVVAYQAFSYVSGVQATRESDRKVAIVVLKRSPLQFSFAPAEKRFYYTLAIMDGVVVDKQKVPFAKVPLDELRRQKGQIRILAELPVSIPAYPLAAVFFAVLALASAAVLEVLPSRRT
ncbi:MAG TPA: hypothetical protein DCM05_02395 [Elusimicrobia bacterium]|nr:hypothetical protein [Elusimicrobiota bacterium]